MITQSHENSRRRKSFTAKGIHYLERRWVPSSIFYPLKYIDAQQLYKFHTGSLGAQDENGRVLCRATEGSRKMVTDAQPSKFRIAKKEMTFVTWNFRALRAEGMLNELEHEMDE